MSFFFYVLYSQTRDRYYIGHTGDDLQERLRRHNSNHRGFTGKTGDWQIVYTEIFPTKETAFRRERETKAGKAEKKLNN